MDEDNDSAQIIYTLQVAQCESLGEPQCPLITLYRGTQKTFGTLVPLGNARPGHNASIITMMVTVEDNMGAKVTAIKRCVRSCCCHEQEYSVLDVLLRLLYSILDLFFFICHNSCRNLEVMVPVSEQETVEWLKKKSEEELWALVKQGNPQDVIPYAMALSSQLNQVSCTALNLGLWGCARMLAVDYLGAVDAGDIEVVWCIPWELHQIGI